MDNILIAFLITGILSAWFVSGDLADKYAVRKLKKNLDLELFFKLLQYVEDNEREHYIDTYGEESNNYLMLDSDLDLHVNQEPNEHIYQVIHKLIKLRNNV
jgi:hypothetical protein